MVPRTVTELAQMNGVAVVVAVMGIITQVQVRVGPAAAAMPIKPALPAAGPPTRGAVAERAVLGVLLIGQALAAQES
jgi:hypothetical protein